MMDKADIRDCTAGWLNYIVHTRPKYEIEMMASALGIKAAEFRSTAQSIIYEGVNAIFKKWADDDLHMGVPDAVPAQALEEGQRQAATRRNTVRAAERRW